MSQMTFTCTKCQAFGSVETTDYETTPESEEGGMGVKTEYWTEIETQCEKCSNSISITLNQTEYPEGDFQPLEISASDGAENISIG